MRVNGAVVEMGTRIHPGDVVTLDGKDILWERLALPDACLSNFVYLKHWKPLDVICTTDMSVPNNIVASIQGRDWGTDRIFPVGRLDEQSTGLILLTSDGRLPNAVLGASKGCTKEYVVTPDRRVTNAHLQEIREGIVITTTAQRDGARKAPLTAPTLPTECERHGSKLVIRLQEGRNRQIRKMLGALGYTVRAIHRTDFMGIGLDGLDSPGQWAYLNETELTIVHDRLTKHNVPLEPLSNTHNNVDDHEDDDDIN